MVNINSEATGDQFVMENKDLRELRPRNKSFTNKIYIFILFVL